MRVRAFAKINLSLRVVGRRADGYHELRTIFQSIALHDTLTIRAVRGPFRLTCDDPRCPADASNLIWRAAERAWDAAGRRGVARGVAVDLRKRIPLEAGLGGGSSDAAAALRAFGRIWRVDEARLRGIGRALGADVPYFFEGGTVLGLERGDLLFPLPDLRAAHVVLVVPGFGVATKDAFAWWKGDVTVAGPDRGESTHGAAGEPWRNDLEAPVSARHPEIARAVADLRHAGAVHAAMTGSGSTVFGLFENARGAARAARAVASSGRTAVLTKTIGRSAYTRGAGLPRG